MKLVLKKNTTVSMRGRSLGQERTKNLVAKDIDIESRDGVLILRPKKKRGITGFLLNGNRSGRTVLQVLEVDEVEIVGLTPSGVEFQRRSRGTSQRDCL